MTQKERMEWLEKEIVYAVKLKEEYALRESLARAEIDRMYDSGYVADEL